MNIADDPIGFVLERVWSDLTAGGTVDASRALLEALAARDYGAAMMLAIAIELDAAKRDESVGFWSMSEGKSMLLDELGRRTLYGFLMLHINDWRELRGRRPRVQVVAPKSGPPPVRPMVSENGTHA